MQRANPQAKEARQQTLAAPAPVSPDRVQVAHDKRPQDGIDPAQGTVQHRQQADQRDRTPSEELELVGFCDDAVPFPVLLLRGRRG